MSKLEIKISKEVEEFLNIHTVIDNKFFFVPFWYEKLDNGNFIKHSLEKPLPEELNQYIEQKRK